jgi:hypothetical protein
MIISGATRFSAQTLRSSPLKGLTSCFIDTKGLGGYDESFMINAESDLEGMLAQFQMTEADGVCHQLALWTDYWKSVVAAKPIFQTRAPDLAFSTIK